MYAAAAINIIRSVMYSDTHFHFQQTTKHKDNTGFLVNGTQLLNDMAKRDCRFALDIGTQSTDLLGRQACVDNAISGIRNYALANRVRNFMYFSAGVWPSIDELRNVRRSMLNLKEQVSIADASPDNDTLHRKVIAIGECGIDHHYDIGGADGRNEYDFTPTVLDAERALFCEQLMYAQTLGVPVIVHSRDAFSDTLNCIKQVGYNRGIIHCFSYGKEEAKAFLDLGWYISLSGSITYQKGRRAQDEIELIKYIPTDRLLCETDSPYLAPIPYRGKTNTPLFVEYVYDFVADILGLQYESFCDTVDKNIERLFNLTIRFPAF